MEWHARLDDELRDRAAPSIRRDRGIAARPVARMAEGRDRGRNEARPRLPSALRRLPSKENYMSTHSPICEPMFVTALPVLELLAAGGGSCG